MRVLQRLAAKKINLDMIFIGPGQLLFVVEPADAAATVSALKELGVPYRIRKGLAKVSVVGAGMHGEPGVMAHVLDALRDGGVAVHQTADSQTTISCLVDEADVEKAVRVLHRRFQLGRGQGQADGKSPSATHRVDGPTREVGDAT